MADNARLFLDSAGVKLLVESLLLKIDESFLQKLNAKMVTLIDEASTDGQIPSAKAVYTLLQDALKDMIGVDFKVVPTLPATADAVPGTIYLIKADDDPTSNVYVQWICVDNQWINLGTSEVDLSNYWSKDELEPMQPADIQAILDEIFNPVAGP